MGDKGLERFHPEADSDPPRTLLQPMREKEKNIPEEGVMVVSFGGGDKWQMTAAGRLLYSHRLDEGEWSPFTEATSVTFSDLAPGKHYFQARAMDRAGNVDPDPAHLEFAVVLPWYQESRLVLIASAGTAAAVFFAWLAYKRHRQLVLSYAQVEKQVAERTREFEIGQPGIAAKPENERRSAPWPPASPTTSTTFSPSSKAPPRSSKTISTTPKKSARGPIASRPWCDQGSAIVQGHARLQPQVRRRTGALRPESHGGDTVKLLGDRFLREVELRFDRAPVRRLRRLAKSDPADSAESSSLTRRSR